MDDKTALGEIRRALNCAAWVGNEDVVTFVQLLTEHVNSAADLLGVLRDGEEERRPCPALFRARCIEGCIRDEQKAAWEVL